MCYFIMFAKFIVRVKIINELGELEGGRRAFPVIVSIRPLICQVLDQITLEIQV